MLNFAEALKSIDRSLDQLPSSFVERIAEWATYPEVPLTRQALETDLGYIRPEGEQVLSALLQLLASRRPLSDDIIPDVRRRQRIFRAALAHGASRQAVRDAYIAEYGALECFSLPAWLAAMKPRFADSSPSQAAAAYTEAVERIQAESSKGAVPGDAVLSVDREIFAALLWGQGVSRLRGAEAEQGSEARLLAFGALMALQGASLVFTQERFPLTFAKFIVDYNAAKAAVERP